MTMLLFGVGLILLLDDSIRHGDFGKFDRLHHWQVGALFMYLGSR
jgi:hypothetical protein